MSVAATSNLENGAYDALKSYLKYYASLEKPGFAVLVTGEWGCGKTYQVKAALELDKHHYISLFGLKSDADVYGAVFAALHPTKAKLKKAANEAKGKSISILGFGGSFGDVISAGINAVVRDDLKVDGLLVFDDLERSAIRFRVLLGVINHFVEHRNCRVVVIAHDDKLAQGFSDAKEKIFGHSIRVRPMVKDAFDSFAKRLTERTQKVIAEHEVRIRELFALSECVSLRVLRHTLMNIDRFCRLLTDDQIANKIVVEKLISLFSACSIDVLRGELRRTSLYKRIDNYTYHKYITADKKSKSDNEMKLRDSESLVRSYNRYKSVIEITALDLSDDLLIQMLVDGYYDRDLLQNYLMQIQSFGSDEKTAAWRRFMNFDSLPDQAVQDAAAEMDRQFKNREVVNLGELMQIVFLRVMRMKNGLMPGDPANVASQCKKYLDDLVKKNLFPIEVDYELFGPHPAYNGFMYWGYEENQQLLVEIGNHARLCEKKAFGRRHPEFRKRILSALKAVPQQLDKLLNHVDGVSGEYYEIPVLQSFKHSEFVDEFLGQPTQNWRAITQALRNRRSRIQSFERLADEGRWFTNLEKEMTRRADMAKGKINSLRIRRHIPKSR